MGRPKFSGRMVSVRYKHRVTSLCDSEIYTSEAPYPDEKKDGKVSPNNPATKERSGCSFSMSHVASMFQQFSDELFAFCALKLEPRSGV